MSSPQAQPQAYQNQSGGRGAKPTSTRGGRGGHGYERPYPANSYSAPPYAPQFAHSGFVPPIQHNSHAHLAHFSPYAPAEPYYPRYPTMVSPQMPVQSLNTSNLSGPGQSSPQKSSLKPEARPFIPREKRANQAVAIIDPKTGTPVTPASTPQSDELEKQKREEKQREEKLKEEKERAEKEEKERAERERLEREEKERLELEAREQAEREKREKEAKEEKERQENEERERKERKEREEREQKEHREREQKEHREREEKEARERAEQKKNEEAKQNGAGIEEGEQNNNSHDSNSTDDSTYQSSEHEIDAGKESEPQTNNPRGKKMYSREFLYKFQALCTDRPDSLPQVEAIVGVDDRGTPALLGQGPRGGMSRRGGPGQRHPGGFSGQRGGKMAPNSRGPMKRTPLGATDDPLQKLKRNVTSLLNKITVEKFEEISNQILTVGIDSAPILDEVIGLAFQKAISEPHFANLYADLCVKLSKQCASFDDPDSPGKKITFKRILLNRCQDEFEKKRKEEALKETADCKTEEEREEVRFKQRRRMIGNIKFIGELYNRSLLPATVVANSIVPKLLYASSEPEELECLCKFMKTSGKILESSCYVPNPPGPPKATPALAKLNEYFDMIRAFSVDQKYDSRIRFMLQDILELRQNNWVPRREEKTAKKIKEIHQEAEEEENLAASLPAVQPTGGQNFRRSNDNNRSRGGGSPAPGNHYDKSRDSRAPAAKQSPQSTQTAFKGQPQNPNLRPNSGKAWGPKSDTNAEAQKQNPNSTSRDNKQTTPKASISGSQEAPSTPPAGPITLEAWEDLISPIFEELFVSHEVSDAAKDFEQQLSKRTQPKGELQSHLVHIGCLKALDGPPGSSNFLVPLFKELCQNSIITANDLEEGLIKTRDQIPEIKLDVPHAPAEFCQVVGLLLNFGILDVTAFQKIYPENGELNPVDNLVQMLSFLSKKESSTFPQLFEKLPIKNYFSTPVDLIDRLFQKKAFSVFGKIPWDKAFQKELKGPEMLKWFSDNQRQIEFETKDEIDKFVRIFLSRVTRDWSSGGPQKHSAWGKPDSTKKSEQETFETNAKLVNALLPTVDLQTDALETIQNVADGLSEKGALERLLLPFYEKKIFSKESLVPWLETRGEQLDAKLKQHLNSLKGEIPSKSS